MKTSKTIFEITADQLAEASDLLRTAPTEHWNPVLLARRMNLPLPHAQALLLQLKKEGLVETNDEVQTLPPSMEDELDIAAEPESAPPVQPQPADDLPFDFEAYAEPEQVDLPTVSVNNAQRPVVATHVKTVEPARPRPTLPKAVDRNKAQPRPPGKRQLRSLPLSELRCDPDIQPRTGLDPELVDEYATTMKAGIEFPPVVVFAECDTNWVADGHHRIAAAKAAGLTDIQADVRQGTKRAAILYAISANLQHGARLNGADKRCVVARLLADDEWGQWSDCEIARMAGVSDKTVASQRREVQSGKSELKPRIFRTRHGTVARRKPTNTRKSQPATKPSAVQPPHAGARSSRDEVETAYELIEALEAAASALLQSPDSLTKAPMEKVSHLQRVLQSLLQLCKRRPKQRARSRAA